MPDQSHRPRPPPNRRRDKAQLSCDPCRHRKLRCDRQHPCGTCSRRAITNSCHYATPSSTLEAQRPVAPRQSASLQLRITELESLVVTLMEGQPLPTPSTGAPKSPRTSLPSFEDELPEIRRPRNCQDDAESPADPGTLNLRESGASYVQSAHWEAILTKVRGLKEDLVTDSRALPGSHLFYGPNRHATREEILAACPPRPVVDRLMALHFDSYIVTPYIIHSKKFLREYEAFWEDPTATSISWIGLMFSLLYIAAQLQTFTIDINDGQAESLKAEYLAMKDAFREKAVQCLILARYTMGGPYILETLITILTGEFVLMKDGVTDGWLLIGMILQLATRMGLHRDPDHFPGISPFEAEMRRRMWIVILQLDLSLSLETGLPRNATNTHADLKEPRNLRDCDFDEHTTEMPPSRSETEWTPVLALITRWRLISPLGLICDINTDISPPSYEEVTKVEDVLEDVRNRAIPPVLRWGTTPHPITDSPNLLVQRVSVETTYHKARILLYRRSLVSGQPPHSKERDRDSVRICLDSALKILSFQEMLHEESQPFGRLCQLRWKVTHILNQDVLLATSVLCLYLQDIDKFEVPQIARRAARLPRAEEIRQQLTISHKIWLQRSTGSAEAGKVAKALSIVLGNSEVSAEKGDGPLSYDFLTDIDAIPVNGFGAAFNNQYFTSGFYSPLSFFDNVLETRGS
ncbi:unnamed protein product [Clonostachys byssicola]|uniref:Zn(2)-C6 fungal-type domain-containing protein n=1 Tax=Clonostachys byssicola TaxID=160290 RepID=A0A9N9Y1L5_9HYPO|nr:unnamed protein product [Clonostachys byssicola]